MIAAALGLGLAFANAEAREQRPSPSSAGDGELLIEVRAGDSPLEGALVRVAGRSLRSDAAGQARFALAGGSYAIRVSADGFQDATSSASVEAGSSVSVRVSLTPAREEEVVVTAARSQRRIEEQPLRVEVVDREDIEEKALMTPGSVAMLLNETTGLRVQTTGPSLAAANVRIQGLRGRYSLLLSDGLPLYGVQGDSLSLLQVPPLDLGQVQIIKGAASALYGPSALGGVIDLVSKRPDRRQRQVLVNATSQSAADLSAFLVEPPRGRWAWTLVGGVDGQRRQELDADGWADLPAFLRGVLRPRVFWDKGDGDSLFATIAVMAEDRRGGTMPGAVAPDGRPFAQELDTRHLDAGAVGRFVLGRTHVLSLRGSATRREERRRFGEIVERGRRSTGFGEAVLNGKAGAHTWLVGAALQRDSYAARDLTGFDYAFTTPGAFAQAELRLAEPAMLGLSARVDHHSRYGTFLSPRASLLYKPARGWTARLSAGTGFFAPTPFLEETDEAGLSRLLPPSRLAAERAQSGSLDLGFARGRIDLNATLFGSRVRDPLQWTRAGPQTFAIRNAGAPARTWGAEFLARYRSEDLMLLLTHAYTHATERDPEGPGRREVPLTPRSITTLDAIWEGDWGHIGLEAYYVGRQPLEDNPYRTTGRGYLLFGGLAERRLGHVHVFLNLENIGNVRQTRWDPLLRPARGPDGRWTVDAWAPLDGFVANGGVRLVF